MSKKNNPVMAINGRFDKLDSKIDLLGVRVGEVEIGLAKLEGKLSVHKWYMTIIIPSLTAIAIFVLRTVFNV